MPKMNLAREVSAARKARRSAGHKVARSPIHYHTSYQYTDATSGEERDSTKSLRRNYTDGNAERTRRLMEVRIHNSSARKL